MTYKEAEQEINTIPKFGARASLSNLSSYLEELGHPENHLRVIHVAGTNGKGSVCAFIESVLRNAGYRTALFTSPHLVRLNERFRINYQMCGDEKLINAWRQVRDLIREGKSRGLKPLTFFEALYVMGLLIFSGENIDYCIMETGLGGRLDATVLSRPVLTVITSISCDHTAVLGNTIEEIAFEKAGIIKPGVPVVVFDEHTGAYPIIKRQAERNGSHIYRLIYENITILKKSKNKIDFSINSSYYKCNRLSVGNPADYQAYNGALAALAVHVLFPEIAEDVIQEGLAHMKWEGRMEELYHQVYVDGAHNPGAVSQVCRTIKDFGGKWSLLFAVCQDKEYEEMIRILGRIPWERVIVTRAEGDRGASAEEVKDLFGRYADCPVEAMPNAREAFREAVKRNLRQNHQNLELNMRKNYLLCLGSLYLVGEIKRWKEIERDLASIPDGVKSESLR